MGLSLLLRPLGQEPGHLLLEGLAIGLLRSRADVAAGGEDMAVFAYLIQRCGLAEAWHVVVFAGVLAVAPSIVGIGDAGDVFSGEVSPGTVKHMPQRASVNEKGLTYLTLAGLVRRHGTVGKDNPRNAPGRQVVQDVLHPGEVGVAGRQNAVLPPLIVPELLATPVGCVKGRIDEYVVGPQVRVTVVSETVSVGRVSHGTVHLPSSQRYHLTTSGVGEAAWVLGCGTPSDFVRASPLSREWLTLLIRRMDVVASVYRLAA